MCVVAKPEPGEFESDEAFLAHFRPGDYERPSVTVDVVVLTVREAQLCALLCRRRYRPFLGVWALPGRFLRGDEGLDDAARDVLMDKGGLDEPYLEQLYTFGEPGRDPRPPRVISVAYMALADLRRVEEAVARPGDARYVAPLRVGWTGQAGGPVDALGPDGQPLELAFDHSHILGTSVLRLRGKLDYAPVGFELLPGDFTLRQLQVIHEAVLGRPLNKDSFRRRMLAGGQLVATGRREANVAYRPAELYRFVRRPGKRP